MGESGGRQRHPSVNKFNQPVQSCVVLYWGITVSRCGKRHPSVNKFNQPVQSCVVLYWGITVSWCGKSCSKHACIKVITGAGPACWKHPQTCVTWVMKMVLLLDRDPFPIQLQTAYSVALVNNSAKQRVVYLITLQDLSVCLFLLQIMMWSTALTFNMQHGCEQQTLNHNEKSSVQLSSVHN